MSSSAYEIASYLVAQGVGAFGGNARWCLNVSREPITPADCITLYDTGGDEPDTDELDLLRPTVQVRVRCENYLEGFAKQEAIRDLLILPYELTMGVRYVSVTLSSEISSIGRDDNDRHLITANYRLTKERT